MTNASRNRLLLATLVVAGFAQSACAGLTPADRGPRSDPVEHLVPLGPSPWREDFGDAQLHDLLQKADARALDIKLVLARLERATADVEAAKASRSPHIEASAITAAGDRNFRTSRTAATPTMEGGYEVDLWGRLARARDAAGSERDAVGFDVTAARLLVGAQTARIYLSMRAAQADHAAALKGYGAAERALALTQDRAALGYATNHDVAARRQGLQAAADLVRLSQETIDEQAAELTELTGQSMDLIPAGSIPPALAAPNAIASSLVDKRPDVQAAFARLAAADYRRAEVIAASRPRFQVIAALGSPDAAIATLLDVRALAWAAAASLSQSALDGGATRAKVHAATAEADMADLVYRQTVTAAWSQMRAAGLAQVRADRECAAAEAAQRLASAALAAGQARHAAGAVDGLGLLELAGALQNAEAAVRQARLHAAEARVRLTQATGGT